MGGQYSGPLIELCLRCTEEEMVLYWERHGTAKPAGPGSAPSLRDIAQWPTGHTPAAHRQDLCVCEVRAIDAYSLHCHACRDEAFDREHMQSFFEAEDMLRERNKAVIQGKKRCDANGGTKAHRVQPRHVVAREVAGIGRMCPCGEKPDVRPLGQQFISICLVCMGVQVDPMRVPAKYSRARLQRKLSLRLAAQKNRTRGPMEAERRATWRVNIERGWVPQDPFLNGA
jgi:hypothetical protein